MKKNGFTLVELMIVVTILGILAAIVIPEFQGHAAQSRESSAKSTLHTIRAQIELYKLQHNGLRPGYIGAAPALPSQVITQLIGTTSLTGAPSASRTPSGSYIYGPYLMDMPVNPYNNLSNLKIVASSVTDFSTVADGSTGWLYQKETGIFKLNYSGTDTQGMAYASY